MKLFYTSIFSILLLASCGGEQTTDENSVDETSSENIVDNEESDALEEEVQEDLKDLELNDGNKWIVDISTDDGMKTVQDQIDAYDGDDSEQLGKDIKKTLKSVQKECDFKGEDHNQYHIILHAMMTEAKQLKKGKSTDPSKMQRYLESYYAHFEVGDQE